MLSKDGTIGLVRIIVNLAVFIEFTNEKQLNPDVSVAIMEGIAAELQLLNKHVRNDMVKFFQEISCEYNSSESFFSNGYQNIYDCYDYIICNSL